MNLRLNTELFALRTHPSAHILVLGTLTGRVLSYQYQTSNWKYQEIWNVKRHRISCRDLRYNMDGSIDHSIIEIVSVGADQMIQCISSETGRIEWKIHDAHSVGINVVDYLSETILATGDDNGCIKVNETMEWNLWDSRINSCIQEITVHTDFISSFLPLDHKTLLSTRKVRGDAFFSVLDLCASKSLPVLSENQEDDLLSSCYVKFQTNHPKICIGTASGAIRVFNKNKWDTYTNQILLSDKKNMLNINTMITWNNDIIVAGTSNGTIHVLNIHPNRHMGIIGDHDSDVDVLVKTYDAEWILSGGNRKINAWKMDLRTDNWKNCQDNEISGYQRKKHEKKSMRNKQKSFFADLT
ncbi:hypothetical protein PCK2_000420 [Pneumocystis canis]|nr:hypothetical protein PCK2_000420 [Pneumocystis canis]